MRIFFDARYKMERVIIEPGEYHTAAHDRIIYTVLGSCVSICLRDEAVGIAGMNHYMLPRAVAKEDLFSSDAGRYGIGAMELLINEMLLRGASRSRLKAKIFGGAHVLDFEPRENNIPDSNVTFALSFLEAESIPILSKDVGGSLGRRIMFFTRDGKVLVEKLQKTQSQPLQKQEDSYMKRLVYKKKTGEFTLFDRRAG